MTPTAQKLDMFGVVEHVQADAPWGSVLDAGTGVRSARWISSLPSDRWTAVSADAEHLQLSAASVGSRHRPQDRFVLGNWQDAALLAGERYDTVLAEYLLGAVEGYAPYFQDVLFARLRPLIGRRIYVVGVDPYVSGPVDSEAGAIVQAIGRLRDGCALLAGVTPYREFPAEWVIRQLEGVGLDVTFARRFPNAHGLPWVEAQMGDTRRLIALLGQGALARALAVEADHLTQKAAALIAEHGGLAFGHDYVIAARPR